MCGEEEFQRTRRFASRRVCQSTKLLITAVRRNRLVSAFSLGMEQTKLTEYE